MKLRAARAARGGRNGRAQTRARALRAHAEGIYAEGTCTCIYLQLSASFSPFFASFIIVPPAPEKSPR